MCPSDDNFPNFWWLPSLERYSEESVFIKINHIIHKIKLKVCGIRIKKPNHQYSCITITQPIIDPKSKEPIFPSKTLEGYLL